MLLKHSLIYFLGRIIPGLMSIFALSIYTRVLSTDQYGLYASVIAIVSFINVLAFQWLNLSLGRFLPEHESNPKELLVTVMVCFIVLMLITGIIGIPVVILWSEQQLQWYFYLAILVAWGQAWFSINLIIANVRLAPVLYGFLTSAKAILAVMVGIALYYVGLGVTGILLGLLIGFLVPTLLVFKNWQYLSLKLYSPKLLHGLIGYGIPLSFTFVLTTILDISDRFFLGWYLDIREVGNYAAAYDLTQNSLGMLMGVIHLAAFPLTQKALEKYGVCEARKQLKNNSLILISIGLPATVGIVMLSENISFVMLGKDFQSVAIKVIPIIAISTLLAGIKSYYYDYSFQLSRKVRGLLLSVSAAALCNVLLNILWIPQYGVEGAAYATLFGFFIGLIVSIYQGRKVFKLPTIFSEAYKVVISSIIMALALLYTMQWRGVFQLIIQISMGIAIFIVVAYLMNVGNIKLKIKNLLLKKHKIKI